LSKVCQEFADDQEFTVSHDRWMSVFPQILPRPIVIDDKSLSEGMSRHRLSLGRLSFLKPKGKLGYHTP
jgi:hypothetical protein